RGRLLRCRDAWVSRRDNDINLETHELGCKAWERVRPSLRRSHHKHDVLPLDVTQLAKSLSERGIWLSGFSERSQVPYAQDFLRLRSGFERHGEEQSRRDGGNPDEHRSHRYASPVLPSAGRRELHRAFRVVLTVAHASCLPNAHVDRPRR